MELKEIYKIYYITYNVTDLVSKLQCLYVHEI